MCGSHRFPEAKVDLVYRLATETFCEDFGAEYDSTIFKEVRAREVDKVSEKSQIKIFISVHIQHAALVSRQSDHVCSFALAWESRRDRSISNRKKS